MTQPSIIRLHANDDVLIAARQLVPGTAIATENVNVRDLIPPGHKMAGNHPAGRSGHFAAASTRKRGG